MIRLSTFTPALLLAAALGLSACGSTTGDRGLSGAGIGAAAGTALGAVTGLGIVEPAAGGRLRLACRLPRQ